MKSSIIIFVTILVCILSCKKADRENPDIISVDSDDAEMNEAISHANSTINEFKEALNSGDTAITVFSLKLRVDTGDGNGEHIWISGVEIDADTLYGYVDNVPKSIPALQEGDYIQIRPDDEISDWMYVRNDTLFGGFTMRLLYKRMSDEEKMEFDEMMGVVILD